jgi:hypothetical protein
MDGIVSALGNLKTGIDDLLKQLESLKNIEIISLTQLPTYEESLNALKKSIGTLYDIFIHDIPYQHQLRLVLIKTIEIEINSLNKIFEDFTKWHKNITGNSCCYLVRIKTLLFQKPSTLEKKLNSSFDKMKPIIKDMIDLENDILGSAKRIQHPILKRAWINVGGNQLNDNDISATMLIQSLYVMLKKEENGNLKKEDYCKKMIENFVRYIDTLAGTPPDARISIEELCSINITPENSASVKGLLGITKQPDEEISKDIIVNDDLNILINNSHEILEKSHRGYGCDWPSKIACEFVVPNSVNPELSLCGVMVKCNAIDQGFGGTGHAQVRYQVNNDVSIPGFSVWRDKVLDGIYNFTITPDKVKVGDTVKIWLCCPPWSGWSLKLKSIHSKVLFA